MEARVWARIDQQHHSGSIHHYCTRFRGSPSVDALGCAVRRHCALALLTLWLNLLTFNRSSPAVVSLTADIYSGQTSVRRGGDAHPGDELRVRGVVAGHPYAELRVYFNDAELSAHCVAETSCVRQGDAISMTTIMRSLGTYRPVLIVSDRVIPAAAGGLDQDAAASLRAGALVQAGDPIPVR